MRTFASLATLELGFEQGSVLIATVNAQRVPMAPAERPAFYERLREADATVPGVASVSASAVTPVAGSTWQFLVEIPGGPALPERKRVGYVNLVSPDFFPRRWARA